MKYLYWIVGTVVVGGIIYFTLLNKDTTSPADTSTLSTTDQRDLSGGTDLGDDLSGFGVDTKTSEPAGPTTNPNLITYKNDAFKFSIDFPKDYYWDASNLRWNGNVTDTMWIVYDRDLIDFDYQGPLPDSAKGAWIDLRVYNVGNQSIEDFAKANFEDPDDPRKVDISTFKAQNISGKEYYYHKSTDPNVGPGVNHPARFVVFKKNSWMYSFYISGNPTDRDQIVSSFRTL